MLGDIQSLRSLFSKYTELRVQENRTGYLTLLKGDLINNTSAAIKGVSARVFDQGGWGFCSNSVVSCDSIRSLIKEATSNASFLGRKNQTISYYPHQPVNPGIPFLLIKNKSQIKRKLPF